MAPARRILEIPALLYISLRISVINLFHLSIRDMHIMLLRSYTSIIHEFSKLFSGLIQFCFWSTELFTMREKRIKLHYNIGLLKLQNICLIRLSFSSSQTKLVWNINILVCSACWNSYLDFHNLPRYDNRFIIYLIGGLRNFIFNHKLTL